MPSLSPYLSFAGNCREALTFYQSCLGGELNLMRCGDSPVAAQLPPEAHDHVLHGTLVTPRFTIMASDASGMRGPLTVGNHVALSLHCESAAEIDTLFARLGDGGTVIDPLADMFWGGRFGTLTDRFGHHWLFNFERAAGE